MIRVSTSDLRKDTADVLNKVAYGGDRVALQRRGKDVAVIVSVEDYELLKVIEDKADLEMIRKIKEKGGDDVFWDDLTRKSAGLYDQVQRLRRQIFPQASPPDPGARGDSNHSRMTPGCRGLKKLKGPNNVSHQVGDYRVLYEIMDDELVVYIIETGHRREVYRSK